MKIVNRIMGQTEYELEPGDVVVCENTKCTIKEITAGSQCFDYEEGANKFNGYFSLEFIDTKGVYRSWKQRYDGGYVKPRLGTINPATKEKPFYETVKEQVREKFDKLTDTYEFSDYTDFFGLIGGEQHTFRVYKSGLVTER